MQDVYSGYIVVRLTPPPDPAADADIGDLRSVAEQRGSADLVRILREHPNCGSSRLVTSLHPRESLKLEERAAGRGTPPRRSVTTYWRLDARAEPDPDGLVQRLNGVDIVDLAYRELRGANPEPPGTSAIADPFAGQQFHLDAAPIGIDAHFARVHPHGSGASVGFFDLEQGWFFSHEDLPPVPVLPGVHRDSRPASRQHGTAVLGVVAGLQNSIGIAGIAASPRVVGVTSHFRQALGRGDHVADAIEAVLPHMIEGDVLLVEWQDALNRPAEVTPAVRTFIEKAVGLGFIVIESAGNGNIDLDTIPELNRNGGTFDDSGAIIVGACRAALDATGAAHDRWRHADPSIPAGSNFGSRVDCHAHGEAVVTAGPPRNRAALLGNGNGPTHEYRRDFGGTSASAAIVAGAAVVLQSMHKGVHGRPLTSQEMRDVFRAHGTPQGTGTAGHIGVMPDLRRAALALGL